MQYQFQCNEGHLENVVCSIEERNQERICKICGGTLKRVFSSPHRSKLIGIREATQQTGIGCMVDTDGTILEPLHRQ